MRSKDSGRMKREREKGKSFWFIRMLQVSFNQTTTHVRRTHKMYVTRQVGERFSKPTARWSVAGEEAERMGRSFGRVVKWAGIAGWRVGVSC